MSNGEPAHRQLVNAINAASSESEPRQAYLLTAYRSFYANAIAELVRRKNNLNEARQFLLSASNTTLPVVRSDFRLRYHLLSDVILRVAKNGKVSVEVDVDWLGFSLIQLDQMDQATSAIVKRIEDEMPEVFRQDRDSVPEVTIDDFVVE